MKEVAYPNNTVNPNYRVELVKNAEKGLCIFCEQISKGTRKEIIAKEKDWFLTPNSYPQRDTEDGDLDVALLIIANRHITKYGELTGADFIQTHALFQIAVERYGLDDGCVLAIRVGGQITGQTLPHLHWQILRPRKREDGTGILFNFHVGSHPVLPDANDNAAS